MKRSIPHILFLSASISLGLLSTVAVGNLITPLAPLTDGNSVVTINPDSTEVKGVNSWSVNGVNQLQQQWFWYRIGEGGSEASIDTLGNPLWGNYRGTRGAYVSYSDPLKNLNVEVDYLLTGGGTASGTSDLAETIHITNTSKLPQTIHFFQYSDFDLSIGGDSVQFPNANTVRQTSSAFSSETVVTPSSTNYEGSFSPTMWDKLNDGSPTTLTNSPANRLAAGGSGLVGPGNVTWAYEWVKEIPAGSDFIISVDKQLHIFPDSSVPEPSTFALLLGAGLGLIGYVWRRRSLGL